MRRAFSLVEILVVITVVVIVMALVIWNGPRWRDKARKAQAVVQVENLAAVLDEYYIKRGGYYPAIDPPGSAYDTESILKFCDGVENLERMMRTQEKYIVTKQIGDVVNYGGASVTLTQKARFILDPWERAIRYKPSFIYYPPMTPPPPPAAYALVKGGWVSAGVDGVFNTPDDVDSTYGRQGTPSNPDNAF